MIKKEDISIAPYKAVRNGYQYRFDANENAFDFNEMERERIKAIVETFEFRRYPDGPSGKVREILAGIHKDSCPQNFLVGNGSDEILYYLFSLYRDKKIVLFDIEYPVYYHLAKVFNMEIIKVELTDEMDIDESWNGAVKNNNADIAIISYPNNPLGKCMNSEGIGRAIHENRDTFFVIDEAYYHFSGKSFEDKICDNENLAVLRTFSKAYSMASMRIGYIYSQEDNIELLSKYKLPYNISSFTQETFAGVYELLKGKVCKQVSEISREKKRIQNILTKRYKWMQIYESETNFLLCKCGDIYFERLKQFLSKNSILVAANYKYPRIDTCFRYTIGTREENNYFLNKLEHFFNAF